MHLFYFLLFLLNLVKATPVTPESSSLGSFLEFEDEGSLPVVDDPDFLDLGNRNTDTQNHHEKRSGPPYNLTYTLWKVTFERRIGDAWDFKQPGWIFRFPAMFQYQKDQQSVYQNPWDIVVLAGPVPTSINGGTSNGDLWYTSNSYFVPFVNDDRVVATGRTYTQYTYANQLRQSTTFNIFRSKNDRMAIGNRGAKFGSKGRVDRPISGFITVTFTSGTNVTGVAAFSGSFTSYNANITGSFFRKGMMLI
ncbi:hypothetical protein FPANT_11904 [Fusarium pseudoanthophilum]|uniref:Uncharacterized protein n=1 Tax=Fusarium pseudoanthophilum TaxID=48495 RepID=A0A8H5KK25_9HYPO|nr:hypothetical protein FPANT_11904 [Fusarium pseudoanthophilum]